MHCRGGGRLFEAGRLLTCLAFSVGTYAKLDAYEHFDHQGGRLVKAGGIFEFGRFLTFWPSGWALVRG